MVLLKFAQACATSSRAVLGDGSMQLAYAKVLHAKDRLPKPNVGVCKLIWQYCWRGLNFMLGWNAMWRGQWQTQW